MFEAARRLLLGAALILGTSAFLLISDTGGRIGGGVPRVAILQFLRLSIVAGEKRLDYDSIWSVDGGQSRLENEVCRPLRARIAREYASAARLCSSTSLTFSSQNMARSATAAILPPCSGPLPASKSDGQLRQVGAWRLRESLPNCAVGQHH